MLKSLSVRQFALIESVDVSFQSGLNILTGETGAGKSILIDAFSLLLGAKSGPSDVREGGGKAVVEGVLSVKGNKAVASLLEEHGLDAQDELIVRREVSDKGQSRCFVNDTPVTLTVMKAFGEVLVDLHGQHDHQSLLRTGTHVDLLDDFGQLDGLRNEYRSAFDGLRQATAELTALREKEQQYAQLRDVYEFQMKEIDGVEPRAGEETDLETELRILENAERLYEMTSRLYQSLYGNDGAVHDQLIAARNDLEDLAEIDPAFAAVRDECAGAAVIAEEITKFIQSYNSRIEFNPERLESIRDRLGQLSLLRKKYGGSLEAVLSHRETIGREYKVATHFEEEIAELERRVSTAREAVARSGQRLSTKRHEQVAKISKGVEAALSKLGIPQATFTVRIDPARPPARSGGPDLTVRVGTETVAATPTGLDEVEFLLSTNPGEQPKPLARIASGGEISRVMLALKSILAKSDRLPLLVFDEIDTGISGRIAQSVGRMLQSLARFHQIIAITHLPQIAGLADAHFAVEKRTHRGRTTTSLRTLDLEERVREVAKLLSGAEVTSTGLEGARELMGIEK